MYNLDFLTLSIFSVLITGSQIVHASNPEKNNQGTRSIETQQRLNLKHNFDPSQPQINQHQDRSSTINLTKSKCFKINNIYLAGNESDKFYFALLPFITGKTSVLGRCMSTRDIKNTRTNIQNQIIAKGYVTSRVTLTDQILETGSLIFTVIPGFIDQIKLDPETKPNKSNIQNYTYTNKNGNPPNFSSAMPMKEGDLLNIRQIEQTLDNLKRIPTVEAEFSITPSNELGKPSYSDILIKWQQSEKIRLSAGLDDSGQKSIGKYQGSVNASIDNLTWHNDILSLSLGRNLDGLNDHIANDSWNYSINYTIPLKNQLFSIARDGYMYRETVKDAKKDSVYSGDYTQTTFNYQYLAYRDNNSKTFLNAGGYSKTQRNYIDETEVKVQRKKTAGWSAGISHEVNNKNTQINSQLIYQHGTAAFSALPPPKSKFNERSSRTGIIKFSIDVNHPIKIRSHQLSYNASLNGQLAQESLIPGDQFSIAGRSTVRGFDGTRVLSGDHGILLRQDISTPIGQSNHNIYAGLDVGVVKLDNRGQNKLLSGHHLVGSAIGFQGYVQPLEMNYDTFAGFPLSHPEGFGKDDLVTGFNLNWSF